MRYLILNAVFVSLVLPAYAAARCEQPYAPEIKTGGKATREQILIIHNDAQTFIAASDIYQACLLKYAQTNPAAQQASTNKIKTNQSEKERIGKAFNAALAAYRQTLQASANASDISNSDLVLR